MSFIQFGLKVILFFSFVACLNDGGYKVKFDRGTSSSSVSPDDVFYDGVGGVSFKPVSDRVSRIEIRSDSSIRVAALDSFRFADLGALSQQAIVGDRMYFTGESNGDYHLFEMDAEQNVKSLTTLAKSGAKYLVAVQNKLYFESQTPETGLELFTYDLELGVLSLLNDIEVGTLSSSPSDLTVINNEIYFTARTLLNGREAYRYIPLNNTLVRITDIQPGNPNSDPRDFKLVGTDIYFTARTSGQSRDIYRYTPSTNLLALAVDISPVVGSASNPYLTVINGRIFFTTTFLFNEYNTVTRTVRTVANVGAPSEASSSNSVVINNEVYYAGRGSAAATADVELYKYSPVNDTTSLVSDLEPGAVGSQPRQLTVLGNELYFTASTTNTGRELFKYNPADGVTELVEDIEQGAGNSEPFNLVSFADKIYFSLRIENSSLHTYDKQNGVSEFQTPGFNVGYQPSSELVALDGDLYFSMGTPKTGLELFKYEVSKGKVTLISDINPGRASASLIGFKVYENKLYFSAFSDFTGRELYSYDPASNNVALISDINPGTASSSPSSLVEYEKGLYFSARNSIVGQALYRFDPESRSVVVAADVNASISLFTRAIGPDLVVYNDELYFAGNNGATGFEIFKYNSVTGQATLVTDISTGTASSFPRSFTVLGGELYFQASLPTTGAELFRYNSVTNQASLVSDLFPGITGSTISNLVVSNNQLFFSARNDINIGNLLRKYDPLNGLQTPLIDNTPMSTTGDIISGESSVYLLANRETRVEKELFEFDTAKNERVSLGVLSESSSFQQNTSSDGTTYIKFTNGNFYKIEK